MKRISLISMMLVVMIVGLLAAAVYAQGVYDRSVVSIGLDGKGEWVNDWTYSAVALKRIWIIGNAAATDTQTVTRVTHDGVHTQAVAAVAISSNAGNQSSFTASYLKYGDKLLFSGTGATNATAMIEYEIQRR